MVVANLYERAHLRHRQLVEQQVPLGAVVILADKVVELDLGLIARKLDRALIGHIGAVPRIARFVLERVIELLYVARGERFELRGRRLREGPLEVLAAHVPRYARAHVVEKIVYARARSVVRLVADVRTEIEYDRRRTVVRIVRHVQRVIAVLELVPLEPVDVSVGVVVARRAVARPPCPRGRRRFSRLPLRLSCRRRRSYRHEIQIRLPT